YRSLVGNDTVADFMENITPVTEEETQTEAAEETEEAEETERVTEAESTPPVTPIETVSDTLNAKFETTAPEADNNDSCGTVDYGIILVFAIIILAIVTIIVIIIKIKR
ncbi:MAG: hypothetical protein HDT47_06855, partial [Ruminococcaceae bacterium]|nr:hypothetical protein [Oscillospiraceae bacterium]